MSDIPRTDEPCYYCHHVAHEGSQLCPGIRIDQLERELTAAQAKLDHMSKLATPAQFTVEENARLRAKLARYEAVEMPEEPANMFNFSGDPAVSITPVENVMELRIGQHRLYGLLPCPMCGGEPKIENTITDATVFCPKCRVKICCKHARFKDTGIHESIMAWQLRANKGQP